MLIVIEGTDGTGKTTQTGLLVNRLKKAGHPVETLNFPQYRQFFGQVVKDFLQGRFGTIKQVDPHLAAILYGLDRWQARVKLKQWLKQNKIVVLNRYTTANLIHQAIKVQPAKRLRFIQWLDKMEYTILNLPKPNLVIYLYLPYQLAYALINKRGRKKDIHEADLDHLKKAAQQGLELAQNQQNWHLVRCHEKQIIRSKTDIANQIWKIVKAKIGNHELPD